MVNGLQQFKSLDNTKLIELIRGGAVGVLPTDTIYGLVAAAGNQEAAGRVYSLKSRDKKPGTIIAASINQLVDLGIPRRYLKPVEQYWPGSVSIIVPAEANLSYLHLGKFSLACRIPKDEKLQRLLEETGPVLTTSANHPGEPQASTINQAEKYFKDQVDFYVDGGDLSKREASTIIRIVDDAVEIVRQGSVKIDEASGLVID